jgi:hypothetical protein
VTATSSPAGSHASATDQVAAGSPGAGGDATPASPAGVVGASRSAGMVAAAAEDRFPLLSIAKSSTV